MQSQWTELEQSLLNELECPVCMEYMRPPITLCGNSHNICNTCKPKVEQCPTCTEPFTSMRNLTLEKLAEEVKYPCTYRKYGCRETYNFNAIGEHQDSCQYAPQICPVTKIETETCGWSGNFSEMKKHLGEAHENNCLPVSCLQPIFLSDVDDSKVSFRFLFYDDEIFFCRFRIKDDLFRGVVNYVGPAQKEPKYRYKIKLFNEETQEVVSFRLALKNFTECDVDPLDSGNCVTVHRDLINGFRNKQGEVVTWINLLRAESNT